MFLPLFLFFLGVGCSKGLSIAAGNCVDSLPGGECLDAGEIGGLHWSRTTSEGKTMISAGLQGSPCNSIDPIAVGDARFSVSPLGKFRALTIDETEMCSVVETQIFNKECEARVKVHVCHLVPVTNCKIDFRSVGSTVHVSGETEGPIQYSIQTKEGVEKSGMCLSCGGFSETFKLVVGENKFNVWCNKNFEKRMVAITQSDHCRNTNERFFMFGFDYKICMNNVPYTAILVLFFLLIFSFIFPVYHYPLNLVFIVFRCTRKFPWRFENIHVRRILLLILMIIIFDQIAWAEGSMATSFKKQGFVPEEVEFKGLYRQTIPESDFEIISHGNGDNIKVDKFKVDMTPGFTAGFLLNDIEVDFKVKSTKMTYVKKDCYNTSDSYISQVTQDTCTEGCDECVKLLGLEEPYDKSALVKVPRSSSWACDGPGCLSVSSGCTCGHCDDLPTGPKALICDLTLSKSEINLCFNVGGIGLCKMMKSSPSFSDHAYQIQIEITESSELERVALMDGKILIGEMNGLNDNLPELGDFKVIGEMVQKDVDIDYRHECHFLEHRRIVFNKCGNNHFGKIHDLKSCVECKDIGETIEITDVDIGSGTVSVNLPLAGITLKEEEVTLTAIKITSCKGCRNCKEGFSCTMTVNANEGGLVDITCSHAQARRKFLVKKGKNSITTTFFTEEKRGELTCYHGDVSGKRDFSLKEPAINLYHSLGFYDTSHYEDYHCKLFSCAAGRLLYKVFGLKGLLHYIWVIGLLALVVVILVILIKYLVRRHKRRSRVATNSDIDRMINMGKI